MERATPEPRDRRTPRLLVVDDEQAYANLLAELFRDEGYQVDVVYDGKEALKVLKSVRRPDLVLCDVMMPGLTGPDVVEAAHAMRQNAPSFVLLSAGTRPDITSDRYTFVPKPVELNFLVEHVQELLKKRPS